MTCKQSLLSLFQTTSHRFDMRATICAATPPVPPNRPHQPRATTPPPPPPPAPPNSPHQPRVTKPQCNGAANSSSTNQNACPHSLRPTLGRIIIGPTIAPTNGNDTALLNCGSRVIAYR